MRGRFSLPFLALEKQKHPPSLALAMRGAPCFCPVPVGADEARTMLQRFSPIFFLLAAQSTVFGADPVSVFSLPPLRPPGDDYTALVAFAQSSALEFFPLPGARFLFLLLEFAMRSYPPQSQIGISCFSTEPGRYRFDHTHDEILPPVSIFMDKTPSQIQLGSLLPPPLVRLNLEVFRLSITFNGSGCIFFFLLRGHPLPPLRLCLALLPVTGPFPSRCLNGFLLTGLDPPHHACPVSEWCTTSIRLIRTKASLLDSGVLLCSWSDRAFTPFSLADTDSVERPWPSVGTASANESFAVFS